MVAERSLSEIASITMGTSPKGDTYNENGEGLPLLNGPTEFGPVYPHCTLFTTKPVRQGRAGDLIFCVRGSTTGRMNWADRVYSLGRGVCSIRGESAADTRFIKYCLDWKLESLLKLAGGGTFPNLTQDTIRNFEIPFPDHRRKIAVILSAYDDLIENNLRRIKILEEMAQNLYREWFVKFRFPGHEKTRFVDSPLGRIPEGWEVKNLLDIAFVKYGKNLPTKKLVPNGDYPVYGAAKIIGTFTEYTRVDRTIITGCRGSVGEMQITVPKCFVTNNSFTFDIQQKIDFFWLFLFLKERGFADVIGGAAQPQITLDGLSKVQILMPLMAIRALFHERVENMFLRKWNLETTNTNLRRTRDLLLPKLISGEVDVSELDITIPEEAA